VLVGPDEVAFTVHENFICAKSKFFQAACRKEWSEGAQKLIRLPEVEPGVFRSYLNWVYTGDLAVNSTKDDPVNPKNTKYSNFRSSTSLETRSTIFRCATRLWRF
jgi:hypothetical protein